MRLLKYVALIGIILEATSAGSFGVDNNLSEYDLKAAFLINFARFTEWPADAFPSQSAPLIIGIYSADPMSKALEDLANTKVAGRPVVVRRLTDVGTARGCHIAFFAGRGARLNEEGLRILADARVLTVGESSDFISRGGVVNFFLQDDRRLRFEINPTAAARAKLKISSKLLQLAIVVGQ